MSEQARAADMSAIRELYAAYSDATLRRDVDAHLGCWSATGVRVGNGLTCTGHAEIRGFWDRAWTMLDKMAFFSELGPVKIEGDRARARCQCLEILGLKGGGTRTVVGVYTDALVREDGRWRFARREYELFMGDVQGAAAGA